MGQLPEEVNVLIFIISIFLALLGILFNGTSLSFFLTRGKQGLGDWLLICLNCVDLSVCLTATLSLGYYLKDPNNTNTFEKGEGVYKMIAWSLFRAALILSGYVTMVLSVTRMISFVAPFYKINKIVVLISIVVYGFCKLVLELVYRYYRFVHEDSPDHSETTLNYFSFTRISVVVELSLFISIAAISSIISVLLLQRSLTDRVDTVKRRATITVAIITVLFCVFNIAFLIVFKDQVLDSDRNGPASQYQIYFIVSLITIPFNSVLNPVVYVIRKRDLREYVRTGLEHVRQGCGSLLRLGVR